MRLGPCGKKQAVRCEQSWQRDRFAPNSLFQLIGIVSLTEHVCFIVNAVFEKENGFEVGATR
jgi:hypothetical protein